MEPIANDAAGRANVSNAVSAAAYALSELVKDAPSDFASVTSGSIAVRAIARTNGGSCAT